MNIVIPINGKNERVGGLFKTPKHLLLHEGHPVIYKTLTLLKHQFPEANIIILAGQEYFDGLEKYSGGPISIVMVEPTNSQVETLLLITMELSGPVMFVDCDTVPFKLNKPHGNIVYVFRNTMGDNQYSNYSVYDDIVSDCNEKEKVYEYAGAGVYYFEEAMRFNFFAPGNKSISGVIENMINAGYKFKADTDNEIFRFGTLKDIIA